MDENNQKRWNPQLRVVPGVFYHDLGVNLPPQTMHLLWGSYRRKCRLCHCVLVENEEQTMTGTPELFSWRISVVYDVAFGHVCSALRMNRGSRASVLVWRLLVEMPAYTLS